MSADDIKLPPLPYPQMPGNDYTASDMRSYARAAVLADRAGFAPSPQGDARDREGT